MVACSFTCHHIRALSDRLSYITTSFPHREGIMSLKSSPGGQSFSFNTMGLPSGSCSRSAFKEKVSVAYWNSTGRTKHQHFLSTLTKQCQKMRHVLTRNDLKAVPEFSHLHVRDDSTVSTIDQVYVLLSKLSTEGLRMPQMRFQPLIYPRHQNRLENKQKRPKSEVCIWTCRSFSHFGSYLTLLPTLSEDLPVVAVTGILQTEESSITEPGMGRVRFQNTETHYSFFAAT